MASAQKQQQRARILSKYWTAGHCAKMALILSLLSLKSRFFRGSSPLKYCLLFIQHPIFCCSSFMIEHVNPCLLRLQGCYRAIFHPMGMQWGFCFIGKGQTERTPWKKAECCARRGGYYKLPAIKNEQPFFQSCILLYLSIIECYNWATDNRQCS